LGCSVTLSPAGLERAHQLLDLYRIAAWVPPAGGAILQATWLEFSLVPLLAIDAMADDLQVLVGTYAVRRTSR
jgi:hypothetical protein